MESITQRADRWLIGLAAAAGLLLLAAGAVNAWTPRQGDRPATRSPEIARNDRLLFDIALMTEDGLILAHPRVLGRAGQPLRLSYGDRGLTLDLDPLAAADGLDLALDLSLGHETPRRIRLRLPLSTRQTVRIPRPGGDLMLAVRALAVDSPEFEAWASRTRRLELRQRVPEA